MNKIKVCSNCLVLGHQDYKFCPYCGIELMQISEFTFKYMASMSKEECKKLLKRIKDKREKQK